MKKSLVIVITGLLLVMSACSGLKSFSVSECQSRTCAYGFSNIFYDGKYLNVNYGTSDNCGAKYRGKVKHRNDSIIICVRAKTTSARCICGYTLTYDIKLKDTCDINLGFEKKSNRMKSLGSLYVQLQMKQLKNKRIRTEKRNQKNPNKVKNKESNYRPKSNITIEKDDVYN